MPLRATDLDKDGDVEFSPVDWKRKANPRITVSTFAAETSAALEGYGMAHYVRAFFCEITAGGRRRVDSFGEQDLGITLYTDCKSLYDHMKCEGTVPEDRYTAVQVAALRCEVSAGPGRRVDKAAMKWLPSRWQLADGLTKSGLSEKMRELLTRGSTRLHELSAPCAAGRGHAGHGQQATEVGGSVDERHMPTCQPTCHATCCHFPLKLR